jgi:uncharacterized repeat protein (TIGR01451 family)
MKDLAVIHAFKAPTTTRRSMFLHVLVPTALLVCLLVALGTAHGAPDTVTVTTTMDEVNGDTSSITALISSPGGDGISLREAVIAANNTPGPDEIVLPAGTHTLSIAGTGEDTCATGDLDVTDDLTITGADQATTIIDGDAIDRVFHIAPSGPVLFDMSDVTIRNGNAGSNSGGGILNSQGAVTLEYCTITSNSAGGVGEGLLGTSPGMGGGGGGLYNDEGSVTLANCTVSYNVASDDDAGIPMIGAVGGGICNGPGTVTLTDSSVVHNSANGFAGIANLLGEISLSRCTVALNQADDSAYGIGGGIANILVATGLAQPSMNLTNSTVTLNSGGGIVAMGATTTTLTNCTVSHNSGGMLGLAPGGIMASTDGSATLTLKNTIVANSTSGDECSGIITSQGHNIASDTTCGLTGTGDQQNTDPLLGPLQDNGGPTLTRALLGGSPAIDAGDNAGCPGTDQRGEPRPEDGDGNLVAVCDIGAYEAPAVPPFSEITIEKQTNGYDADSPPGPYISVGNPVNWTYEVSNSGDTVLSDIYVIDNQGVTVTCLETSLDPDDSMTCTASGTAQIGQYSNTATVYGTPPVGEVVSDSDTSHYFGTSPAIDIEKATNGQDADGTPGPEIALGDPVDWTYEVVNRGNVPLTGITVLDDQGAVVDCPHTALGPAEFMICTASGVAELGQYENVGSVTGYYGTTQVTDSDLSHYLGVTRADLSIAKTSDPVTAYPGDQITYGIHVTNLGPSEAFGVQVTDVLPAGVAYELDTGSCVEAPAGTLTCDLGHMAAGESAAFDVYVRVPSDAPVSTIANTVTVGSAEPQDPEASNNTATAETVLLGKADLSIHKFGKPDGEVQAGEELTYTLFVDNLGPGLAHTVVVSDVLQSNGSFDLVSVTSDRPASCSPTPGGTYSERLELTCGLDEVLEVKTPDAPGRWIITIVVRANEAQSVNNVARVTTADLDPDPSNNQAVVEHEITEVADLSITKEAEYPICAQFHDQWDGSEETVQIDTPCAGRPLTYTLTVMNWGPSTAENIVLEELLPEGVTVTAVDSAQGSCTTGIPGNPAAPLVCNLGDLLPDTSTTVDVFVEIDRDYPMTECGKIVISGIPVCIGEMENDAVVYSDSFDPDNTDNRAHLVLDVCGASGLEVTKTAFPDPVSAGEGLEYTVTITNTGPSIAQGVIFTDRLPGEPGDLTFTGFEFLRGGGTCTYVAANHAVQCSLDDIPVWDLANPQTEVVLHFSVDAGVADGTTWDNCLVRWDDWEASSFVFPTPHDVCAVTTVQSLADLSVRKISDPWKVYAGEQLRYDLSVTNNGPGIAYSVTMTDNLPVEAEFELATDPSCQEDAGVVTCNWGVILPGQSIAFSIFGRVLPQTTPGVVNNEVIVTSDSIDQIGWNDRHTAANKVLGKADLKIQKFGKPDGQVYAGEELTYTVIVDNLGPGYGHDVYVLDQMNSSGQFELLSIESNLESACTETSGTFTETLALQCSLQDPLPVLSPDEGRWVLTVKIRADERQDIDNTAYAYTSDWDPDPSNNEAIAEHEITAVANLEIVKTAWGEVPAGCGGALDLWENEVAAGGTLTYTLTVTNHGPSTAENVVVRDQPLPSVPEIEEVTPSQGNCDEGYMSAPDYLLTCNLGTLLPDQSETVTVVASVPPTALEGAELVNVARVYSDMFDENNANDVQTNRTIVSTWSDLEVLKTQDPAIALPGWDITYSITVTNLGPSDAQGIFISDTIPVQVLGPQWTCCASDDGECDVPCEPPVCPEGPCEWPDPGLFAQADIPAGEWVIYTITGTLDWWPCGPFTNTVEIIPPQSLVHEGEDIDPCDENNTDIAVNEPMCHFDPLVLKDFPGPDSTN